MNKNIREIGDDHYDGLNQYREFEFRYDVLVGDRQYSREYGIQYIAGEFKDEFWMNQLNNYRKEAECELVRMLANVGLSIDDAKPLPMPKGMTFPSWYVPSTAGA